MSTKDPLNFRTPIYTQVSGNMNFTKERPGLQADNFSGVTSE